MFALDNQLIWRASMAEANKQSFVTTITSSSVLGITCARFLWICVLDYLDFRRSAVCIKFCWALILCNQPKVASYSLMGVAPRQSVELCTTRQIVLLSLRRLLVQEQAPLSRTWLRRLAKLDRTRRHYCHSHSTWSVYSPFLLFVGFDKLGKQ